VVIEPRHAFADSGQVWDVWTVDNAERAHVAKRISQISTGTNFKAAKKLAFEHAQKSY
jgi:hypothetical protein